MRLTPAHVLKLVIGIYLFIILKTRYSQPANQLMFLKPFFQCHGDYSLALEVHGAQEQILEKNFFSLSTPE
jgi:hypothetical protein